MSAGRIAAIITCRDLGASDLLPHVHEKPRAALIAATIGGLATAGLLVYALDAMH